MTLKDKRVLVIGGGSGIGLGIARGAAREGARVVIASRDAEKIAAAAKPIGATSAAIDVRDEAPSRNSSGTTAVRSHRVHRGRWETLVPGISPISISRKPQKGHHALLGRGRRGQTWRNQAAARGSYTITNGMLAHRPRKGMPVVTASARAVEGLAIGLAVDLAPVRVNCVCPA